MGVPVIHYFMLYNDNVFNVSSKIIKCPYVSYREKMRELLMVI